MITTNVGKGEMKKQLMEHSLCCFLLFAQVVTFSFGLNYNGENGTKFDNCLTWSDDRHALFLTCRVANYLLPVTFYHKESNTSVYCDIHGNEKNCTPQEKNITINKTDSTVTIVLAENKQGRDLNGKWYCMQGNSTQTTNVSLSRGIIRDSWVMLRGKNFAGENGSRFINLECSSCRAPKNLYAEFIVNNVTHLSVWRNENGDCRQKQQSCSFLGTCNCSQTGNMFSINFQLKHPMLATNFSCYMQFNDSFRRGVFSTTASKIYEGKDFQTIEQKTVAIVPNREISDYSTRLMTTINPDVNKQTGPTTTKKPSELPTDTKDGFPPEFITLIVVSLLAVIFIAILTIWCCFFRNNKTKERETFVELERSPLLERETNVCKICCQRRERTIAKYACFDCRQFFCGDCAKTYHDISDETKHHTLVDIEKIPDDFSPTIFNCPLNDHENALLQYFCNDHGDLICKRCKPQKHSSCTIEMISEMLTETINEVMNNHQCNLDDGEALILSFQNSVKRNVNSYKRKAKSVLYRVECSDETCFQKDIESNICPNTLTKSEAINQLSEMETLVQSAAENVYMLSDDLHKAVERQAKLCEFVAEFGGNLHIFILAKRLGKSLNDIILKLTDNKNKYCCIDVTLVNGNIITFKRVLLNEYLSRTPSMSSRDFLDQIETETKRVTSMSSEAITRPMAAIQPTINVYHDFKHDTQSKKLPLFAASETTL